MPASNHAKTKKPRFAELKWLALGISAFALSFVLYLVPRSASMSVPPPPQKTTVTAGGKTFSVEIARTKQEHRKGLGGRDAMALDEGMLFLFDKAEPHGFWMSGMRFPLDIIWLKGEVIQDIVTLAPPSPERPQPEMYDPDFASDRVLEINAGLAQELDLKPGDAIEIQL